MPRGIDTVWDTILEHRGKLEAAGELSRRRQDQARAWMWSLVEEGLRASFRAHPGVAAEIPRLEQQVATLETTPVAAAQALLALFND